MPRMTTAQAATMSSPPDGMMIFNTDSTCICVRRSGVWRSLCAEGNGQPWSTTGNSNTDPISNFVGTKDNQSLVFRTNNAEVMRILTDGNIGIGTTTPTNKLHIVAATNPLRLEGLQSGTSNDSVMTVDMATGVVRMMKMTDIGANAFTANNGLTKTGSLVQLGGLLIAPTSITTTATNTLAIAGLEGGTGVDSVVVADASTGVLRRMKMSDIGANAIGVTNGLTKAGNIISLGGTLTTSTTLGTSSTNVLNITGLQTSAVTDSVVTIDATTGQLRRTTMAIIGANAFTANNGLTKTGSNVQLGGSLVAATAVNTSVTNTLTIGGLQHGLLATDSVMTLTAGGVLQQMSMSDIGANSITVSNGLTKVGNLVTFGGSLTTATTINTSGLNTLSFGGLTTGSATDSVLTTGTNGLVRRVSINDLAAAAPDFWLDGAGVRPDGTTDNTERVYRTGDVGIGSAVAPTSKFQVTGSVGMSITTTTSALALDATHYTVIANCSSGAIALTLPAASSCAGRLYYITKSDETTNLLSFSVPLKLTETTNVSSYNYTKRLTIQSDGLNWRVISE
ncbi:MAG: hypothetical protein U5L45_12700 [Saprospiraceae bacterium]|nr:hypothetical protein [Saprospiraceae bacterium]